MSGQKLTPKQRAFLDQYMIDFNGTQAAIRAFNVDLKNARNAAYKMLTSDVVREELGIRLLERHRASALTVERVELMLRNLAEVDVLDIVDERGCLRPLQDIPPHARAAIKAIRRKEREHVITGEVETYSEVELWDKKGAIELLGKYRRMFSDQLDVNLGATVAFTVTGLRREKL